MGQGRGWGTGVVFISPGNYLWFYSMRRLKDSLEVEGWEKGGSEVLLTEVSVWHWHCRFSTCGLGTLTRSIFP